MNQVAIALPTTQINDFCQHWKVDELALFGSGLRDDFHAHGTRENLWARRGLD